MTAKEKAEELIRKYYTFGLNNTSQSFSWYECKQCALIAVDEILLHEKNSHSVLDKATERWEQVKHEITKL